MDEQWTFVGSKKQQRWLFYAWEPRFKKIIAHAFGSRSTETLKKLLERLAPFNVTFYCTDDWQPYTSCLPEDKHIIGKYFTQRIERQNLTLKTHLKRLARRTICFSRLIDIHDKVIGDLSHETTTNSFDTSPFYACYRFLLISIRYVRGGIHKLVLIKFSAVTVRSINYLFKCWTNN